MSAEALIDLHRRLATLTPRSHGRRMAMHDTATLYGVSEQTLYRALEASARPKALHRANFGIPRALPKDQMERYCELIAAIKVRTSNKKGRLLSTTGALRLIEEFGVDTPDGHVQPAKGILNKTTVKRYLQSPDSPLPDDATIAASVSPPRRRASSLLVDWLYAILYGASELTIKWKYYAKGFAEFIERTSVRRQ